MASKSADSARKSLRSEAKLQRLESSVEVAKTFKNSKNQGSLGKFASRQQESAKGVSTKSASPESAKDRYKKTLEELKRSLNETLDSRIADLQPGQPGMRAGSSCPDLQEA